MKFFKDIDSQNIPLHIAIIMDGNGRWAKKMLLPKQAGHKRGADVLKKISGYANDIGVKYMTVYAFSTENWKREPSEVEYLMKLLNNYLDDLINDKEETTICVNIIGDEKGLSEELQNKITKVREKSKSKTGLVLNIAINYGGRDEIKRAVMQIGEDIKDKKIQTKHITEELISSYLDTNTCPDPDILIRTSNEYRLSNFMLWQIAYTEMFFVKKFWPDFTTLDFKNCIIDYQNRDRRFGGR